MGVSALLSLSQDLLDALFSIPAFLMASVQNIRPQRSHLPKALQVTWAGKASPPPGVFLQDPSPLGKPKQGLLTTNPPQLDTVSFHLFSTLLELFFLPH